MRLRWGLLVMVLGCGRVEPQGVLDAGAPSSDSGTGSELDSGMVDAGFDGGSSFDGGPKDSGTADAGLDGGSAVDAGGSRDAGPPDAGLDAGSAVGDRCAASSQCGGSAPICQGFGNGVVQYCVATCTAPPELISDGGLPRADCPQRGVCLPDFNRLRTGTCVFECQRDADCMSTDAYCRKTFFVDGGPVETSNGYCAPTHCRSRGCPSTFECFC